MEISATILELPEVGSTQEVAAELVRIGDTSKSVVFAHDQLAGRGRFGREWVSKRGDSLTMSLIFWSYPDLPNPWLIGMSCAVAVAKTLNCQVRWPNDISFGDRKTGGILTEIFPDPKGRRTPVVGIGINLLQEQFPPELAFATSAYKETGHAWQAIDLAHRIIQAITELPAPQNWPDLELHWRPIDVTKGKRYKLQDGREASAIEVTQNGSLLCEVDGKLEAVLAADAIFGGLVGTQTDPKGIA